MRKTNSIFIDISLIILAGILVIAFSSCCSCQQIEPAVQNSGPQEVAQAEEEVQGSGKKDTLPVYKTCIYNQFKGTAHILALNWINEIKAEITFTFTLDNPELKEKYRFPHFGDVEIKKLIYFNTALSSKIHSLVKAGDVIPCLRSEIITGMCTPVVFSFPDLESQ
jgi:hypothetical protein